LINQNHCLFIVGTGIKFVSHLTQEAKTHIEKADKVLYLLNEPAMQAWITQINPNSESLDPLYKKHYQRSESYQEISNYILSTLEKTNILTIVVYGHPILLCDLTTNAGTVAKNLGYHVKTLPGISSEACLFADLIVNPYRGGLQSFEATDFLIYKRNFDTSSHLVLWQVESIGALCHSSNHNNEIGIKILMEYLIQHYSPDHELVIYEAAQYPQFEPNLKYIKIKDLINSELTSINTLYIPPYNVKKADEQIINQLKKSSDHLFL
jgi:uncharacterized protein YabN with tetrapyrrole methylase and pyrophosphatase domain